MMHSVHNTAATEEFTVTRPSCAHCIFYAVCTTQPNEHDNREARRFVYTVYTSHIANHPIVIEIFAVFTSRGNVRLSRLPH